MGRAPHASTLPSKKVFATLDIVARLPVAATVARRARDVDFRVAERRVRDGDFVQLGD